MKKALLLSLAFAALLMTGCRKSNVQPAQGGHEFGDFEMSLTAGNGDDEKSSIEGLKIHWQLGDKLHVVDSNDMRYLGYLTATEIGTPKTTATFKGFITQPTAGHRCKFYFVGNNDFDVDGDGNYLFDVHEQYGGLSIYVGNAGNDDYEGGDWKGDFNDISNGLQLMKNRNKIEVTQAMLDAHNFGDKIIRMRSMMAISHIDLQVNGTSMGGELTDIVTVTGTGCIAKANLNIKTGALTPVSGQNAITLKKANKDYYMVLIPEDPDGSDLALTFTATSRNGEVKSITPEVAANTFYNKDEAKEINMVTVVETDEWINFGLPSPKENLKWSKKNIGATNGSTAQSWYGDYYAWGATTTWYEDGTASSPTWKSGYSGGYTDANTPYYSGSTYTKYTFDDGKTTLEDGDDVARQHASWGGSWRMPTGGTSGEWQLLKDNTYFQWTTDYNGISDLNGYIVYKVKDSSHKGYLTYYYSSTWNTKDSSGTVVSDYEGQQNPFNYTNSDPHMFLPAVGYFYEVTRNDAGITGSFWSSTLDSDDDYYARHVDINSQDISLQYSQWRLYGAAVRPVQ